MATRHIRLSKDGLDSFSVLSTTQSGRQELWIEVDHYFIPDASEDRKVIVLGVGGLDANEFNAQVDKLIEELGQLKVLAAREFSRRE